MAEGRSVLDCKTNWLESSKIGKIVTDLVRSQPYLVGSGDQTSPTLEGLAENTKSPMAAAAGQHGWRRSTIVKGTD